MWVKHPTPVYAALWQWPPPCPLTRDWHMRSIFSLQQIWNLEIVHGSGAMGNFLMCVCLELDWVLKGRLTKKSILFGQTDRMGSSFGDDDNVVSRWSTVWIGVCKFVKVWPGKYCACEATSLSPPINILDKWRRRRGGGRGGTLKIYQTAFFHVGRFCLSKVIFDNWN